MKVVIAIDDSDCSFRALDSVMAQEWPQEAEFHIITVVEPVYPYAFSGADMAPIVQAQQDFEASCQQLIALKVEQLQNHFPNSNVTGSVVEGLVANTIAEESKAWNADLIVMGSHGRRGFQRLMLGSVAEKVASIAPCSVEIVKPKSQQSLETRTADSFEKKRKQELSL